MADERKQGRKSGLSRTDLEIWRAVVRDAIPLPGQQIPELPPLPGGEGEVKVPVPPLPLPTLPPLSEPPPTKAKVRPALPWLDPGAAVGVDKRLSERVKGGELPIEGRLDLHGMTQDQAHGALVSFVTAAAREGRRCVLVITGKGWREGQPGVLRTSVPRWLNAPNLREKILLFSHASPRHGGEGALYVLLKRKR